MRLAAVERWARAEGFTSEQLRAFHDEALTLAVSRLLQAAHRERYPTSTELRREPNGDWKLLTGEGLTLGLPVTPLPFGRFEANGLPVVRAGAGFRIVRTAASFLRALREAWRNTACPLDRLVEDFENSLANHVLNAVLFAQRPPRGAPIVEPTHGGHNYYPFPALRNGPSVGEVVACSNVTGQSASLPLAVLRDHSFVSVEYGDEAACFGAWSGRAASEWLPGTVPVHPWQVRRSKVFASARLLGLVEVLPRSLRAVPLASQRTCRVEATGYDVKLPIDVTLTGERRLLYPSNALNAPAVSALAKSIQECRDEDTMGFQYDVASVVYADELVGSHVGVIVRGPLPNHAGCTVVPALLLWSPPHLAEQLLQIGRGDAAVDFFRGYCRLVMCGPVEWLARWGMAFEPHLQNALIEIRAGRPERLILRDLDATILDARRVPALLRERRLELRPRSWSAMSPFADGQRRLLHSLFHAHLGQTIVYLVERREADPAVLAKCVEEVWRELLCSHNDATRRRIVELKELGQPVKRLLALRMRRSMAMSWA